MMASLWWVSSIRRGKAIAAEMELTCYLSVARLGRLELVTHSILFVDQDLAANKQTGKDDLNVLLVRRCTQQ